MQGRSLRHSKGGPSTTLPDTEETLFRELLYISSMVRTNFRRILAVSLALLVFLTTTGFTLDIHYCQDQLKSISFIGEAKNCHEAQSTKRCGKQTKKCQHSEDADKSDLDNCCHNERITIDKSEIEATQPQVVSTEKISLQFIANFITVFIDENSNDFRPQSFKPDKPPPLPDRDILVLYQTFLI